MKKRRWAVGIGIALAITIWTSWNLIAAPPGKVADVISAKDLEAEITAKVEEFDAMLADARIVPDEVREQGLESGADAHGEQDDDAVEDRQRADERARIGVRTAVPGLECGR